MIDVALLKVLKKKRNFVRVRRYIPESSIEPKTMAIVKDFGRYFEENESAEIIDFEVFNSLFFNMWHKNLKEDTAQVYRKLLERVSSEEVEPELEASMVNQLVELEFAERLGKKLVQYEEGEEVELLQEVKVLCTQAENKLTLKVDSNFAGVEDHDIVEASIDAEGYTWHVPVMNEFYRPIKPGDLYIVAARPGVGKTTFLTHLNAHVAPQMRSNKIIVWFNNESKRQRIMSRQITSSLKKTRSEILPLVESGQVTEEYTKVMGRPDKVRVYDVHGKTIFQLEDILRRLGEDNIGLIIYDMLDNVKFPGMDNRREDQRLEALYQYGRELGVRFDAPVFPTSQLSYEAMGKLFPEESHLKESKTGKQGACDGIIMIGRSDDPMKERIRGISMPKTKSKLEGVPNMREEVLFDEDRGIYG